MSDLRVAVKELRRLRYLKWSSQECRLYEARVSDTLAIQLLECEGGYSTVTIAKLFPNTDTITNMIEMTEAEFRELYKLYKHLKG